MPLSNSEWKVKKGGEGWSLSEQIRISPAPKTGGWAGKQLRFLSASRGQAVLTDLEQGSLAVNRRCPGLPSMHRMWFHQSGHSLGYAQHRGTAEAPEIFFFDPQARLLDQRKLPANVADVSPGTQHWFVACRDGKIHAFTIEGWPLWNELVPCARRDQATNAMWGLPIFHPRLHAAADGPALVVAADREVHRYEFSGQRVWSRTLPTGEKIKARMKATEVPTREERLSRLGLAREDDQDEIRTGYLRLALDHRMNAGWLKEIEVYDIESGEDAAIEDADVMLQIGFPRFEPGVAVVRTSWHQIVIGTEDGLVHVFDWDGTLQKTFRVGEAAVSGLLVTAAGLKAAYCAGRVTLFDGGQVGASAELPEYFADLADCDTGVLVWLGRSVWLIDSTGCTVLAAEAARAIQGVWGHGSGFYILTRQLSSFQPSAKSAIPGTRTRQSVLRRPRRPK